MKTIKSRVYFTCFHYLVSARYIHVEMWEPDVKEESYFTNGKLFLCTVVMFLF